MTTLPSGLPGLSVRQPCEGAPRRHDGHVGSDNSKKQIAGGRLTRAGGSRGHPEPATEAGALGRDVDAARLAWCNEPDFLPGDSGTVRSADWVQGAPGPLCDGIRDRDRFDETAGVLALRGAQYGRRVAGLDDLSASQHRNPVGDFVYDGEIM